MALPPPQESGPETPSRDLPASYRNPWQTLGENLQAVVADSGLRSRELWRRNGQGTLWCPSWWPRDLAPLFWPLLLGLVLLLFGVTVSRISNTLHRAPVPVQQPVEVQPSVDASVDSAVPLSQEADLALEVETESAPEPEPQPQPQPQPQPEPPAALEAEQQEPDPLQALLSRSGAEGLLIDVRAMPDQFSLVLEVSPAFNELPKTEQQQCADRWQQWVIELGYEHLELRDSRAGLLARDALVGDGMIMLTPSVMP